MKSKVERALHGPSWTEVITGAVLSLILGIVVGAALLIVRPVISVRDLPKEPVAGAVYYQQGVPGSASSADQVYAKAKSAAPGQTIKLSEEEVNSVAAALMAPAAKPGQKAPTAPSDETLATGTPNVRIRNGVFQVGVPITLNVLGVSENIIAQSRGGFAKHGDVFVYEPTEIYFGSCPVQRLPFLSSYIRHKLLVSQNVPSDLANAWSRLSNVTVEGNTLALTM